MQHIQYSDIIKNESNIHIGGNEMEYTKHLEDIMFENEFNIEIVDFLGVNSGDLFLPFNERLSRFICKYAGNECNPKAYLTKALKKKEISFGSKNTNWFSGERPPKKSEDARNKLYKIAFAMELNVKQTEELFCKVYFDRPFDLREPAEYIYWYCLNNSFTYQLAEKMISEYWVSKEVEKRENEEVFETVFLKEQLINQGEWGEKNVISFMLEHPYNFSVHNKKANEIKKILIEQIMVTKKEVNDIKKGDYDNVKSCIGIEIKNTRKQIEFYKGKQISSIQFMLDFIIYMGDDTTEYTRIPNEVIRDIGINFPFRRNIYTKTNPTYDELRKMIILLFFYKSCIEFRYIFSKTYENYDFYKEFISSVNDILFECGLPLLYLGNPLDWLFAFCAKEKEPLETFRFYMNEILEIE